MGIRGRLAESMIRSQGREKALPVIMKLLGFDEEVWRTSEEGKHFKLETSTGEIKAGFGGKLNGRKIGETFTPNRKSGSGRGSSWKPKLSATPLTASQQKTLKSTAKRIRNLKKEQYFIIGPDGEVRASGKGDKHSVGVTVGEKREHLKGAISLHNHPQGGTFSTADLSDFGYGATQMHVSGPDGDYCLKNLKVGQPDQYNGWVEMREALEKSVPQDVSLYSLMKQADKNLKNNETQRKMQEIADTWVKMKDAGASTDTLQAYFDNSGYNELAEKAKKEREDEIRRLETEPFHQFYQENAEKYGFEYTFTPAEKKEEKQIEAQPIAPQTQQTREEWKPTTGTINDFPKEIELPEDFPEISVVNNPDDSATAHSGTAGKIEINLANYNSENADSILAHEAAHQLTNSDPNLQAAVILNYGDVFGRYNQEKGYFDGIFGEGSPEEAFATGMSEYLNHPDELKQRYPDAYSLFENIEQENPGAIGYIRGTVEQAKEKISSEQGRLLDRVQLAKERVFEESQEAKQPKSFPTDHEVMKEFKRIEGDHTWQDDLKRVNPGFDDDEGADQFGRTPRNQNCQNCITAYEARRRGFDVEADVALTPQQTASGMWREAFGLTVNDAIYTGKKPGATLDELLKNPMSGEQVRKSTDKALKKMGNGARAVVCVVWKDAYQDDPSTVKGHVFIAENHNGVIRYIDPQSGEENVSVHFENARPEHTAVYRVDDKPLTEKAAERCVKP